MTYCEEVGLKVGDKIVYTGLGSHLKAHKYFEIGEILTMIEDDCSDTPLFSKGEIEEYFDLRNREWEKYEEKSPLFGKKYKVTPEVSELLQKAVFEAGGKWDGCLIGTEKTLRNWGIENVLVKDDGRMSCTECFVVLSSSEWKNAPEGILEIEKKLVLKDVVPLETPQQKEYKELLVKIEEHKQSLVALEEQAKKLSNN